MNLGFEKDDEYSVWLKFSKDSSEVFDKQQPVFRKSIFGIVNIYQNECHFLMEDDQLWTTQNIMKKEDFIDLLIILKEIEELLKLNKNISEYRDTFPFEIKLREKYNPLIKIHIKNQKGITIDSYYLEQLIELLLKLN